MNYELRILGRRRLCGRSAENLDVKQNEACKQRFNVNHWFASLSFTAISITAMFDKVLWDLCSFFCPFQFLNIFFFRFRDEKAFCFEIILAISSFLWHTCMQVVSISCYDQLLIVRGFLSLITVRPFHGRIFRTLRKPTWKIE